jgi:hypothetical protein
MATTLFLALFSSSSVLGSFALRSSINNKNNGIVNGVLSKEYWLQEEDDRLRFHVLMKEEPRNEEPLVAPQRASVKVGKDHTPTGSALEEATHFDRTKKMPDTMKTKTSNRELEDPCSSELATIENCLGSNFGCDRNCISAVEENLSISIGEFTCSQYEADVCPSYAACGCEMCGSAVADYINCLNPTCNINCGVASTPSMTLPSQSSGPPVTNSRGINYKNYPEKKDGASNRRVTGALVFGFSAALTGIFYRYKYQKTAEKSSTEDAFARTAHDETENYTAGAPSVPEMLSDSFNTQSYYPNSTTLPNTTNPEEERPLMPSYKGQCHIM